LQLGGHPQDLVAGSGLADHLEVVLRIQESAQAGAEYAVIVSEDDVNGALKDAADGALKGILEFCEEKLVSIDFKENPASAIVDGPATIVAGGNMVKVLAWYDNEWGYSVRVADLCMMLVAKGL